MINYDKTVLEMLELIIDALQDIQDGDTNDRFLGNKISQLRERLADLR